MSGYLLQLHRKVGISGIRRKRIGIRETNEENIIGLKTGFGISGRGQLQGRGDFIIVVNCWHIETIQSRLTLNWLVLNFLQPAHSLHPGRSNPTTLHSHTPLVHHCQATVCGQPVRLAVVGYKSKELRRDILKKKERLSGWQNPQERKTKIMSLRF